VTWLDALKAAIISIPKLLDAIKGLGESMAALAKAADDRKTQERLNEQRIVQLEAERSSSDEQLARLARRLSDLEQRK
jgi:chromosome segregation ATPase